MTLIELMLAIFIMTIIITAAMSVAAIYLKGRSNIKKSQDSTEEMSLALNMLAKEIRMSNCDTKKDSDKCSFSDGSTGATKSIKVIDNNKITISHKYEFDGTNLKKDSDTIISGVKGEFYVYPSIKTAQIPPNPAEGDPYFAKNVPRITIMIKKDNTVMQTTVSMRGGYQDVTTP